jgi:glycosyltransferase involved in cell wall biosynthesis
MKKKIINVITPTYFPAVNGVSFVVQRNVQALLFLGFDVNVLTCENSQSFGTENVYTFDISGNGTLINPIIGNVKFFITTLRYLSNSAEMNIFHTWHSWSTNSFMQNEIFTNCKNIIYSHGTSFSSYENIFRRLMRNFLYISQKNILKSNIHKFDAMISIVENTKHPRCYDAKIYKGMRFVIPNPIPDRKVTNYYKLTYREKLFRNNNKTALCISNFEDIKNQQFLVRAISEYDLNLVLVASKITSYYNKVNNFIQKNNLSDRIKILIDISDDQVQNLYETCDFFAFASKNDFSPLVLIESKRNKLPFISFITADIDSTGGFFCKTNREYSVALESIISMSDSELNLLGIKGYENFLNNNSNELYIQKINNALNKLLY